MAFSQKKILIVDDDSDMVELLRLGLSEAGYTTEVASTGAEALEKARRSKPHLILLDFILPEVNGLTVCEMIRRQTTMDSVRIIMMTGLPGEFPRLAGLDAGADAYVAKPVTIPEMLTRIGDLFKYPRGKSLRAHRTQNLGAA